MQEVASVAKEYYDSPAHEIYKACWGGENHHLGLFDEAESIQEAAQKANENLLKKIKLDNDSSKILDMGSGFCGLPRFIARNIKCQKIVGLNISQKENDYAQAKNKEEGFDHLIDITEGDFNNMPFSAQEFDIIVSQDAMLHSPDKKILLKEAARILKTSGQFVFSDILELPSLTSEEAQKVYQRVQVPHLSSFEFYRKYLPEFGFEIQEVQDLGSNNLGKSYLYVYNKLKNDKSRLMKEKDVPENLINQTLDGLNYWVERAFENKIGWGLFVSKKL